jgi:hypothetical protein
MISNQTETDREIRLQKNNVLQKRKRSDQSPSERKERLDKVREDMKTKQQKNRQVPQSGKTCSNFLRVKFKVFKPSSK